MLPDIHDAIAQLIYREGGIAPDEVDVRFEMPTKEWIGRLSRPTIVCFLHDLAENTDLRRNDFQETRANGRAERRVPPRRFDLRYLVSAIATEAIDEQLLLWRTLETILRHPYLPFEVLPEGLRTLDPPLMTRLASSDDGPRPLELWGALGAEPRPALSFIVTAPLDLARVIDSPLVLTRTARYLRAGEDEPRDVGIQIGGVVRGPGGQPQAGMRVVPADSAAEGSLTNGLGQFHLAGISAGPLTLRVVAPGGATRTVTLAIPADSYDIDLA